MKKIKIAEHVMLISTYTMVIQYILYLFYWLYLTYDRLNILREQEVVEKASSFDYVADNSIPGFPEESNHRHQNH